MDENRFEKHLKKTVKTSKEIERAEKAKAKELKDEWYEKFEEQQLLKAMHGYARKDWRQFQNFTAIGKKDFIARMDRITERTDRELEILERMMNGDI